MIFETKAVRYYYRKVIPDYLYKPFWHFSPVPLSLALYLFLSLSISISLSFYPLLALHVIPSHQSFSLQWTFTSISMCSSLYTLHLAHCKEYLALSWSTPHIPHPASSFHSSFHLVARFGFYRSFWLQAVSDRFLCSEPQAVFLFLCYVICLFSTLLQNAGKKYTEDIKNTAKMKYALNILQLHKPTCSCHLLGVTVASLSCVIVSSFVTLCNMSTYCRLRW